jgi:prepilin-type N-terminal cleavage/methylation domain-containing protein
MSETHHPNTSKRRRSSAGFSMIEVLVAVALLAIILLALMGLISAGIHRAYSGKKMTEATILAQAAMERANVYAAYTLLGAAKTDTGATQTWTRNATTTTPDVVSGTSAEAIERTAWHDLLANADLPATNAKPATLTVTMTPVPAGATFDTATMVQIVVDCTWVEWGTRQRQVRLQALNLRVTP